MSSNRKPTRSTAGEGLGSENQNSAEHEKHVHQHANQAVESVRQQQVRTANRRFRRGGKKKRVRSRPKDWFGDVYRESDELEYVSLERIMPRDESDRRRAFKSTAIGAVRNQPYMSGAGQMAEGRQGIVTVTTGMSARVELTDSTVDCTIRGILTEIDTGFTNAVAVGDQVDVSGDSVGGWVVEDVLPRRNSLTRTDAFLAPRQQVIAANIDQLLIVSSWRQPDIWLELIDRYLIAAQQTEISPFICINKTDLAEDPADLEFTMRPYEDLGYPVIGSSAMFGQGLEELSDILRDRITLVVGMSGTGKSSLLSALQPDLSLRTAHVNKYSGQGRHTTTQARMLKLDAGGYVVDTPGIREFGLSGLTRAGLADYFPEIASLAPKCRFSDCAHNSEPDCAVRAAEEVGEISAARAHSYGAIWAELDV